MSAKGKNKNRLSDRRKRHVIGKEEKYLQERDKSDKEDSGINNSIINFMPITLLLFL
jgi:hypothetical protein